MERLKHGAAAPATAPGRAVRKIVFACDAGMGSSAMGASILRQKLQRAGVRVAVEHAAVSGIPDDADVVITHRSLAERARQMRPLAEHIALEDFLKSPVYDELAIRLRASREAERDRAIEPVGPAPTP
jgi:mannitol PTS system EIICBA or EIICB component